MTEVVPRNGALHVHPHQLELSNEICQLTYSSARHMCTHQTNFDDHVYSFPPMQSFSPVKYVIICFYIYIFYDLGIYSSCACILLMKWYYSDATFTGA